ncbi:MAG: translesion DNA synthesis-associated protein ImuA [Pseudohongiellaceae bacterium]|nr:translesion DNA synthesis-associated protein ImuA [Pseudohongiellaceae bacterium]
MTKPSTNKGAQEALQSLLNTPHLLWRGKDAVHALNKQLQAQLPSIPSGYDSLDACLPWRGWPNNAIVEIIHQHWGCGELQLVLPLMRQLSQAKRWILWISPPCLPYAPGLVRAGIDPAQIIVVHDKPPLAQLDTLWSAEKALQSDSSALVLLWPSRLHAKHLRRLQLAASKGNTLGIVFHQHHIRHSPSVLQIRTETKEDTLELCVLKARGCYHTPSLQIRLEHP